MRGAGRGRGAVATGRRVGRGGARGRSRDRLSRRARRDPIRSGARTSGWSSPATPSSEPELARDLYGAAAGRWVDEGRHRHYVIVPAFDDGARRRPGSTSASACSTCTRSASCPTSRVPSTRRPGRDSRGARRRRPRRARAAARRAPGALARLRQRARARIPTRSGPRSWRSSAKPELGNLVAEIDDRVVGNFFVCPLEMSSMHVGLGRPDGAAFLGLRRHPPGRAGHGRRSRADRALVPLGARAGYEADGHRLARDEPALVALLAGSAASARRSTALPLDPVERSAARRSLTEMRRSFRRKRRSEDR